MKMFLIPRLSCIVTISTRRNVMRVKFLVTNLHKEITNTPNTLARSIRGSDEDRYSEEMLFFN